MFVTTTVLNFTPVFARPVVADTLAVGLLQDTKHYGARLHSFVVMPEHVHLLVQLPNNLSCPKFVQRLKSAAANRCLPLLEETDLASLSRDTEFVVRGFWKLSFRSYVVSTRREADQKIDYIDNNPVKRSLVPEPGMYPWCSARFYGSQLDSILTGNPLYTEADGWDTERLVRSFPNAQMIDLRQR